MSDIWEDGVVIMVGEYEFIDGDMTGSISMADFSENTIEIDCGGGFFWRGTSQEFSSEWKKL